MKAPVRFLGVALAIAILALGSEGLSSATREEQRQREARASLSDLRGVHELQAKFNNDAGKVRLVLLLSPT